MLYLKQIVKWLIRKLEEVSLVTDFQVLGFPALKILLRNILVIIIWLNIIFLVSIILALPIFLITWYFFA